MAERYLGEIRTVQPRGPYHLGGFCFGGLVAVEMAQRLARDGEEVALVVLCDAPIPRRGLDRWADLARRIARAERPLEALRAALSAGAARVAVRGEAGPPPKVERAMDAIRAAYRPPRAVPGPVLVVRSSTDGPGLEGWMRLASGPAERVQLPVEHRNLLKEPGVALVADVVRDRLLRGVAPRGRT
jgi:thioesterase domain-containing protein